MRAPRPPTEELVRRAREAAHHTTPRDELNGLIFILCDQLEELAADVQRYGERIRELANANAILSEALGEL